MIEAISGTRRNTMVPKPGRLFETVDFGTHSYAVKAIKPQFTHGLGHFPRIIIFREEYQEI